MKGGLSNMNETEETRTNTAVEDSDSGDTPQEASLLERGDQIAKRLEDGNKEAARILKKQEELAARELLGGKSNYAKPAPKKEVSDAEYAQAALQGKLLKK